MCKLHIFTEVCERIEKCFFFILVEGDLDCLINSLCLFVACKAVEVTDPKKIPDARMTASTVYGSGYQPYYAEGEGSIQKGEADGVQRALVTGQTIFKLIWAQCILFVQWPRKR